MPLPLRRVPRRRCPGAVRSVLCERLCLPASNLGRCTGVRTAPSPHPISSLPPLAQPRQLVGHSLPNFGAALAIPLQPGPEFERPLPHPPLACARLDRRLSVRLNQRLHLRPLFPRTRRQPQQAPAVHRPRTCLRTIHSFLVATTLAEPPTRSFASPLATGAAARCLSTRTLRPRRRPPHSRAPEIAAGRRAHYDSALGQKRRRRVPVPPPHPEPPSATPLAPPRSVDLTPAKQPARPLPVWRAGRSVGPTSPTGRLGPPCLRRRRQRPGSAAARGPGPVCPPRAPPGGCASQPPTPTVEPRQSASPPPPASKDGSEW
eukprot:scaffold4000_cov101-Isochrysis_galbana.AAC.1